MTNQTFKPSAEDIRVAADTMRRDATVRQWLGKACSYHPRELPDHVRPPTNALRGHAERVLFVTEPLPYGSRYIAYMSADRKRVTTWTGETLATITRITSGDAMVFGRRTSGGYFNAVGIDGRAYHGRHNGTGMYLTMRLDKVQS